MSWLYLPASVASNSALKRQAVSELCVALNAILTQSKSSRPACRKGRSRTRRHGTTLSPLTGDLGTALWTSLLVASRARTSAQRAKVRASQRERAPVFGPRCSESFARFDLATCSLRTCQCSLLGGSDVYSQTYPRAGTMRTGIAYQHEPLAPLTAGTGSSLWPTPSTMDTVDGRTREPQANRHSLGLAEQVKWPTMSASQARSEGLIGIMRKRVEDGTVTEAEAEAMMGGSLRPARMRAWPTCPTPEHGGSLTQRTWPTPSTEDHKDDGPAVLSRMFTPEMKTCDQRLRNFVAAQAGGQLNPTWVEWLMGFPLAWTDLGASATLSYPKWLTTSDCESSHT